MTTIDRWLPLTGLTTIDRWLPLTGLTTIDRWLPLNRSDHYRQVAASNRSDHYRQVAASNRSDHYRQVLVYSCFSYCSSLHPLLVCSLVKWDLLDYPSSSLTRPKPKQLRSLPVLRISGRLSQIQSRNQRMCISMAMETAFALEA